MDLDFGQQMYFLLSSIKDIQATIRAIDTKVSILLAALAIPLPQVAVFFAYWHARGYSVSFAHVIMALAVLLYVLAVYVAVKTLVGIGDATPHIRGVKMMNTFYAGGMFALNWRDSLRDRPGVQSSKTVDEYIDSLPTSQKTMKEELATEMMALAYIRDIKLYRQRLAFTAAVLAGAAAVIGLIA
ncbi:MAG TPA: hypothetical protein VFO29_00035 [Candidatus Rubrimentiphilum sp.]|nr:hypothetical protein [Candidatus Rubrimentiphilum sp.]